MEARQLRDAEDRLLLRSREPMHLHGSSLRLSLAQTVSLIDDRVAVQAYVYRLQEADARESWLLRWEYFRDPPTDDYCYPLAHMHFNGAFASQAAAQHLTKGASHLHVPTRRLPLELVLWHLIAEWGVAPKTGAWRGILETSIAGFNERQRAP